MSAHILLPCPFCGARAEKSNHEAMHGGMISCTSCGAEAFGPKWNRRAVNRDHHFDALVKALDRMTRTFQPFRVRPIGGEGSRARLEQQDQIEAHAEATRILASVGSPLEPGK